MSAYRKLLELAAKAAAAAGAPIIESAAGPQILHRTTSDGVEHYQQWNPIDDDGEALRLAVRLGIAVVYQRNAPPELGLPRECAVAQGPARKCFAESGRDEYAATRNAIVSAAAEIGREMLKGGAA